MGLELGFLLGVSYYKRASKRRSTMALVVVTEARDLANEEDADMCNIVLGLHMI